MWSLSFGQAWLCAWEEATSTRVLGCVGTELNSNESCENWERVDLEILKGEPWADIKCFHAGGEAKWWLSEAKTNGYLDLDGVQDRASGIIPFIELTPDMFARIERRRAWLRRVGYYSLFPHG